MSTLASDDFTRANNASAWGTATGSGGGSLYTWSQPQGGTTYNLTGNKGVYGPTVSRATFLLGSATQQDTEILCKVFMFDNGSDSGPLLRSGASGNTGYIAYMESGSLHIAYLNSSLVATSLASTAVSLTYNNSIWLRFQAIGSSSPVLKAKVWQAGNAEPGSWTLTYTDAANHFTSAGQYGLWCWPDSSTADGCTSYSVNDTIAGGGATHLLICDGNGGVFS